MKSHKKRPRKGLFNPDQRNPGGRAQITQQMYNHYNALLNAKPTINIEAEQEATNFHRNLRSANSRPRSGQIYRKKKRNSTSRIASAYNFPLSIPLHAIQPSLKMDTPFAMGFQYGQYRGRNYKKADHLAMEHMLNLKSHYRKLHEMGSSKNSRSKKLYSPYVQPARFFEGNSQSYSSYNVAHAPRIFLVEKKKKRRKSSKTLRRLKREKMEEDEILRQLIYQKMLEEAEEKENSKPRKKRKRRSKKRSRSQRPKSSYIAGPEYINIGNIEDEDMFAEEIPPAMYQQVQKKKKKRKKRRARSPLRDEYMGLKHPKSGKKTKKTKKKRKGKKKLKDKRGGGVDQDMDYAGLGYHEQYVDPENGMNQVIVEQDDEGFDDEDRLLDGQEGAVAGMEGDAYENHTDGEYKESTVNQDQGRNTREMERDNVVVESRDIESQDIRASYGDRETNEDERNIMEAEIDMQDNLEDLDGDLDEQVKSLIKVDEGDSFDRSRQGRDRGKGDADHFDEEKYLEQELNAGEDILGQTDGVDDLRNQFANQNDFELDYDAVAAAGIEVGEYLNDDPEEGAEFEYENEIEKVANMSDQGPPRTDDFDDLFKNQKIDFDKVREQQKQKRLQREAEERERQEQELLEAQRLEEEEEKLRAKLEEQRASELEAEEQPLQVVENLEIDEPDLAFDEARQEADGLIEDEDQEIGEALGEGGDEEDQGQAPPNGGEGQEEEGDEEMGDEMNEEMLQFFNEIPHLKDTSEEALEEFKEQMLEHIVKYRISSSDEFDSLFQATHYKNNNVDYELLESIFDEIAEILQAQLEEGNLVDFDEMDLEGFEDEAFEDEDFEVDDDDGALG